MTAKDYKIETSIDGETWDTVYSGTVPATDIYIEKNANSNQRFVNTLNSQYYQPMINEDTNGFKEVL